MPSQSATAEGTATEVALRYFDAVAKRDVDAMVSCWKPGEVDRLVGQGEFRAPDGIREYFSSLFAAFPDFRMEVLATTAEEDRCAVRWRATGTFAGPGTFQGLEPNGARVELEGCDVVRVADGLVVGNDAYVDGADIARQLGVLPGRDSAAELRMTALVNRRTRMVGRAMTSEPERVAEGVWLIRGGFPSKTMNVYLIEEADGGVCVFDAGIKQMANAVAAAGARMGGIRRVVLGHGHADHRGVAPSLGAPVFCHPAERADAEGDGGLRYFDFSKLDFPAFFVMPRMLRWWDGGPVKIAGTVEEGVEVAGFEVIHLPGHAPGLIGLWRESDRLALVSDCFYTIDPQTGRKGDGHPRYPHTAFNLDTLQAKESIAKLAALDPAAAWAGHADPVTGNVREQLQAAADEPYLG